MNEEKKLPEANPRVAELELENADLRGINNINKQIIIKQEKLLRAEIIVKNSFLNDLVELEVRLEKLNEKVRKMAQPAPGEKK